MGLSTDGSMDVVLTMQTVCDQSAVVERGQMKLEPNKCERRTSNFQRLISNVEFRGKSLSLSDLDVGRLTFAFSLLSRFNLDPAVVIENQRD
jgi:hypothetical protein